MADLSFYQAKYGINSIDAAFEKLVSTFQNYYDANYYVDWPKVYSKIKPYRRELLLLSSLCDETDIEGSTRALLHDYPKIIKVFPILMACRNTVEIVEDAAEARVSSYDFSSIGAELTEQEIERYTTFLKTSGLLGLLSQIKSVSDYVTGVEVGMDTNARKNRGGNCGTQAIVPFISQAQQNLPQISVKFEASYDFLATQNFNLPEKFRGIIWDVAFWTRSAMPKLTVMEINHYGGTGSKPPAIAREYAGRQIDLDLAKVGFIWVTDGRGWVSMHHPLREAFDSIHYIISIRLAKDGLLDWALRQQLSL
jgi:DpnII restriction endonuclease.